MKPALVTTPADVAEVIWAAAKIDRSIALRRPPGRCCTRTSTVGPWAVSFRLAKYESRHAGCRPLLPSVPTSTASRTKDRCGWP